MRRTLAVINKYGIAIVNGSGNYKSVVNEKGQLAFKKRGKGNYDPIEAVLYDHSNSEDIIVYKPVVKPNKGKKDVIKDPFRYSIVMAQGNDSVLIDLPKQSGETKDNVPSRQTIEIMGINTGMVLFNFRTSAYDAVSIVFDVSKGSISVNINGKDVWYLSQYDGIEDHKTEDYMNAIINALIYSCGGRWKAEDTDIIKSIEPGLTLCTGDFIEEMKDKANQSSNNPNFMGYKGSNVGSTPVISEAATRGRRGKGKGTIS